MKHYLYIGVSLSRIYYRLNNLEIICLKIDQSFDMNGRILSLGKILNVSHDIFTHDSIYWKIIEI